MREEAKMMELWRCGWREEEKRRRKKINKKKV
jgi:hypothetical protein